MKKWMKKAISVTLVAQLFSTQVITGFAFNTDDYETIGLGTREIELSQDGNTSFVFIPEEDGWYDFYSTGDIDTVAELYAEDDSLISENDDADNRKVTKDFKLNVFLNAGSPYRLDVWSYLHRDSGTTDLTIAWSGDPVKLAVPENAEELQLETRAEVYPYEGRTWFSFTPEESGFYNLYQDYQDGDTNHGLCVFLFDDEMNEMAEYGPGFQATRYLEADRTYYYEVNFWDDREFKNPPEYEWSGLVLQNLSQITQDYDVLELSDGGICVDTMVSRNNKVAVNLVPEETGWYDVSFACEGDATRLSLNYIQEKGQYFSDIGQHTDFDQRHSRAYLIAGREYPFTVEIDDDWDENDENKPDFFSIVIDVNKRGDCSLGTTDEVCSVNLGVEVDFAVQDPVEGADYIWEVAEVDESTGDIWWNYFDRGARFTRWTGDINNNLDQKMFRWRYTDGDDVEHESGILTVYTEENDLVVNEEDTYLPDEYTPCYNTQSDELCVALGDLGYDQDTNIFWYYGVYEGDQFNEHGGWWTEAKSGGKNYCPYWFNDDFRTDDQSGKYLFARVEDNQGHSTTLGPVLIKEPVRAPLEFTSKPYYTETGDEIGEKITGTLGVEYSLSVDINTPKRGQDINCVWEICDGDPDDPGNWYEIWNANRWIEGDTARLDFCPEDMSFSQKYIRCKIYDSTDFDGDGDMEEVYSDKILLDLSDFPLELDEPLENMDVTTETEYKLDAEYTEYRGQQIWMEWQYNEGYREFEGDEYNPPSELKDSWNRFDAAYNPEDPHTGLYIDGGNYYSLALAQDRFGSVQVRVHLWDNHDQEYYSDPFNMYLTPRQLVIAEQSGDIELIPGEENEAYVILTEDSPQNAWFQWEVAVGAAMDNWTDSVWDQIKNEDSSQPNIVLYQLTGSEPELNWNGQYLSLNATDYLSLTDAAPSDIYGFTVEVWMDNNYYDDHEPDGETEHTHYSGMLVFNSGRFSDENTVWETHNFSITDGVVDDTTDDGITIEDLGDGHLKVTYLGSAGCTFGEGADWFELSFTALDNTYSNWNNFDTNRTKITPLDKNGDAIQKAIYLRCRIMDDYNNEIYSEPIRVTQQDVNCGFTKDLNEFTYGSAGGKAELAVEFEGSSVYGYRWEYASPNNPDSFRILKRTKKSQITVDADRYNGYKFRCVAETPVGWKESRETTIKAIEAPGIVGMPEDIVIKKGETAVIDTLTVEGDELSYRWLMTPVGEDKWEEYATEKDFDFYGDVPGVYALRCEITDLAEQTVSTDDFTVTVQAVPEITAQPQDVTAAVGAQVGFFVKTEDASSFRWQRSDNGTDGWTDISGVDGSILSFKALAEDMGKYFRCIAVSEDGVETASDAAQLIEAEALELTGQPVDVIAGDGEEVSFTVTAKNAAKYQWFYSQDGSEWESIEYADGDTLTLTAGADTLGQYRCKVTGLDGTRQTSSAAKLESRLELKANVSKYLDLEGRILLNFTYNFADDVTEPVMTASVNKVEYTVNGVKNSNGTYTFSLPVAAPEINDETIVYVSAEVDGVVKRTEDYEFNVTDYCYAILDIPAFASTGIYDVMISLLNYGSYAQTYFDHNADDLANAGLESRGYSTEITDAAVDRTAVKRTVAYTGTKEATFTTKSLSLEDNVSLTVNFNYTGSTSGDLYLAFRPEGSTKDFTYVKMTKSGKTISGTTTGVPGAEMSDFFEFYACRKTGNTYTQISDTYYYSPECYVNEIHSLGSPAFANLETLLNAMMTYGKSCKTYFNH